MRLPYHLGMGRELERTEARLRPLYGTGHYNATEEWCQHHHYRRGQAYAPAILSRILWAIRRGCVPDRMPSFLDDWKTTLGIRDATGTVAEVLDLLLAVAQMPRDHTAQCIEDGLENLTGVAAWVVTDLYDSTAIGGNGTMMAFYVNVPSPILNTSYDWRWRIAKWYLWRMTPAHCECVVHFIHVPKGPCLLGDEE